MFSFSNKRQEAVNPTALVGGSSYGLSKEPANKGGQNLNPAPTQEEYINNRIAEVEEQRKAFLQKKPDFDMKAELENKVFMDYLWVNGLSVEDAYLLAHRDEIIEASASDAIKRMEERRNRISENGAGKSSPVSVKKNPKEMSDKEIDSIIERVRNGEKISF